MDKWVGKTAVVTGSATGIGRKLTEDLAGMGLTVIAIDYTQDKMDMIFDHVRTLNGFYRGKIVPMKCDVRHLDQVKNTFDQIEHNYGGVDILINNAAYFMEGLLHDITDEQIAQTVETNLTGVLYCTKQAIASMKKKNDLCYIVLMNSISGHYYPSFSKPILNCYMPTKAAITSFADHLRRELRFSGLNIKVSSLSPGIVDTPIFARKDDSPVKKDYFKNNPTLTVKDISDTVTYLLSTPPHVQIQEILVRALHEPV